MPVERSHADCCTRRMDRLTSDEGLLLPFPPLSNLRQVESRSLQRRPKIERARLSLEMEKIRLGKNLKKFNCLVHLQRESPTLPATFSHDECRASFFSIPLLQEDGYGRRTERIMGTVFVG